MILLQQKKPTYLRSPSRIKSNFVGTTDVISFVPD